LHKDKLKTNEIWRGLVAVLFTGIVLLNGKALQATEGIFLSIVCEILSVA
jgi:hypothetical protein